MSTTINQLQSLQEYQRERSGVFPSLDSARWAVRQHRSQLVEAGALVKLADRLFLDPALADDVFVEAGRQRFNREP
jgi:hypothetical protein